MKVVPLEEARMTLPELVELAKVEPVILTLGGQPMVSVRDLSGSDWESASLVNNPRFQELIEQSRRSYRENGGIGLEQVRREFGLDENTAVGSRGDEV
jgi:hypothetical protein